MRLLRNLSKKKEFWLTLSLGVIVAYQTSYYLGYTFGTIFK